MGPAFFVQERRRGGATGGMISVMSNPVPTRRVALLIKGDRVDRRSAFLAAGGFNEARYPRPQIEDIELGYRLHDQGGRNVIRPEIQAAHLKQLKFAGFAIGLLFGGGLFLATMILVVKGGPEPGKHLALLRTYFPGYSVSARGSFIGFIYAFVVGYAFGRIIGTVYNRLVRPA